jgi:hypothetical protein
MLTIVCLAPTASHESTDSFFIHAVDKRVTQLGARGDLELWKYPIEVTADRSR